MRAFSKIIVSLGCVTLFMPNAAYACMEMEALSARLNRAEIVFEGHVEKTKKIENENRFKPGTIFSAVNVYQVDKGWKGIKSGQEVNVIPQYGVSANKEDDKFNSPKVILALNRAQASVDGETYYRTACPDDYPITWWHKLNLVFKYPGSIFE